MILQKEFFQLLSLSLFVTSVNPLMAAITEHPGSQSNELRKSNVQNDLQGVWDFRTITPLERPEELKHKEILSDEDEAELVQRALERQIDRPPPPGGVGGYNQFWMDRGTNVVDDRRTSLIVDPSDGKIPELTENSIRQKGSLDSDMPSERPVRYRAGGMGADGPEDRGLAERCILGFNAGPPMAPGGYNNNMQLFQTDDYVVILNEMVHHARIVPLDNRPHLPSKIKQWMGNSRGRWEHDTLVVETTNFTGKTASFAPNITTAFGTGQTLHLTERFKRLNQDTLLYEYTVSDPSTFTQSFTVAVPMKRGLAPLFEYACHEGNYAMFDILAGARVEE
tara:strand:- start:1944 stop:2954 length:1011 start_codon:yes stop_codon:yes gene_type:complete